MNEQQLKDLEKLLVEEIDKRTISTIITHEEIEDLILIRKQTAKYYSFLAKISDLLLNYNKSLKVVKGVGYKILSADEVIDKALKIAQKGEKRLSEAMKMVVKIDPEVLSLEYKLKYDAITVKYQQMNANLIGGIKEISLLTSTKKDRVRRY